VKAGLQKVPGPDSIVQNFLCFEKTILHAPFVLSPDGFLFPIFSIVYRMSSVGNLSIPYQGGLMDQPKMTKEELLEKAKKPAQDSMKMHPYYKGKIEVVPKCVIRDINDFAIWYTPGVAEPCKAINKNPELAYQYTNKANMVGIVSDGTRVLGLGDIGPLGALPVMEGKALLFKYLGGVDAFPICLDTKDPDDIIKTVKLISPSFGGINLEDISNPKCFYVLDKLRAEATIPVWHDDQQGTAAVTLGGLINALKVVKKKIGDVKITMIGIGAANVCITRMIIKAGADPKKFMVVDSKGILNRKRDDIKPTHKEKMEFCQMTNGENREGGIAEAMKGQDVVIALSQQGPDTIKKEWVSSMADNAIVFVCANPIPEMWPWDAKDAGARVVATGRSDFPNQVNNSIGFPGIFRGTLDIMARTITDEMCIAAAYALAERAEDQGITEDYLLPTMDDWEVFAREAVAVAKKAMEQGVARLRLTEKELFSMAEEKIRRSRDEVSLLMEKGIIAPYKE
jgi:malate dehydrogenase (oxaloacetate-decarboxylating)